MDENTEVKGFSFYRSYYEAAKELPTKEEQAEFLMAVCSYVFEGKEPEIKGVASAMFKLARPNLETSVNRAKAGSAKSNENQNEIKQESNENQNGIKTESNEEQNANKHETINDYMINDYMINDNEKEKINKKEKEPRHKYGQYQNVLLSDSEMMKLQAEFPDDWQGRIENVSEYCASHGRTYKNYLATIRNWAKKDSAKIIPIRKNDAQAGYARAAQLLGIVGEDTT